MFDLDVIINGKSVTKYPHEGRVYVEGRRGSEYSLKFRNRSGCRVIAVFSVDGLSVMDGKTARFEDTGYVVEPFSSITIPGWRLSGDDVAKFTFGDQSKSYAKKSGKGANVGVIGCVVFYEKQRGWWLKLNEATTIMNSRGVSRGLPHETTCDSCTFEPHDDILYSNSGDHIYMNDTRSCGPTPIGEDHGEVKTGGGILRSTSCTVTTSSVDFHPESAMRTQELGTEFGKRTAHRVQEVVVEREDKPTVVMEIHYDSRKRLQAMGIDFGAKVQVAKAFPDNSYGIGCTPPDGWRGCP